MANAETPVEVADEMTDEMKEQMLQQVNHAEDVVKRNLALTLQEFEGVLPVPLIAQVFVNQLALLIVTVGVDANASKEDALELWNRLTSEATDIVFHQKYDEIVDAINESVEEFKKMIAENEAAEAEAGE